MTLGTGKRSYRACLRCRRRKTRCDLDGTGEPNKPPCVTCYHSGSDCLFAASRRGWNSKDNRRRDRGAASCSHGSIGTTPGGNESHDGVTVLPQDGIHLPPEYSSDMVMEEYSEEESPGNLRMALRNPSDALQILERSQDDSPRSSLSLQRSPSKGQSDTTGPGQWSISGPQFTARSVTAMNQEPWSASQPSQFGLNEYELVQRGLLHSSVLPELLQIFATSYHPYCPIVPHYFLGSKAMERIQKEDYFLLTVTLTIASRDSPRHVLIHRYCWDHTQHLLLEVLLAHPWSQTPRTVEGLILLSEWLPHIQTDRETPNIPKSLSSEDRTAWSLIGLAIRLGYLLRLNQAAFRKPVDDESTDREERKRLVWTFVYLVDRQISVRLGHPFWSRGPALSSNFTEKDFPSLKSSPEVNNMNYAFVLEATLELTQIIYNSHQVLYPSTEKTLAMIYDGDYPIYLDDFERSITAWHAKWRDIQAPANVKTTLLLTYEYTRLYVNAFSFQAVVTRESVPRSTSQQEQPSRKQKLAGLFSPGIMSLPDGRYVFEGIQAAKSLLGHMCRFEPRQTVCYLPSRFHLYGVYAAVFLHKAQSLGAFKSATERQEVTNMVFKFISIMNEAPLIGTHSCRVYSAMLKRLWYRRNNRCDDPQRLHGPGTCLGPANGVASTQRDAGTVVDASNQPQQAPMYQGDGPDHPERFNGIFENGEFQSIGEDFLLGINELELPSVEEYLFGSFWPGITEFGIENEVGFNHQAEALPTSNGL